jgi:pyridoxine kinase
MTHALSISSQVAYGAVGNSAAVPAMEWLGLTIHALPTVVLSNHPGHGRPVAVQVAARDLAAMLDALDALGVLGECSGVMTGYFADTDQIRAVAHTLRDLKDRKPSVVYLCDPVLGDDERGLYVPDPVAAAIRETLLPLADAATPNRFELEWLSRHPVVGREDAVEAARKLSLPSVVVTSVPGKRGRLLTMLIDAAGWTQVETEFKATVPHGTGDLLSGLYLGHRLLGSDSPAALRASVTAVERVIESSAGGSVLNLASLRLSPP